MTDTTLYIVSDTETNSVFSELVEKVCVEKSMGFDIRIKKGMKSKSGIEEFLSNGSSVKRVLPIFSQENRESVENELKEAMETVKAKAPAADIKILNPEMISMYLANSLERSVAKSNLDNLAYRDVPVNQIQKRSFEIISKRISKYMDSPVERSVLIRMIHSAADFTLEQDVDISDRAVLSIIDALKSGECNIITDVRMVASGISRRFSENVHTAVAQESLDAISEKTAVTRTAAGIEKLKDRLEGSVVVIGNAPTALIQVVRLYKTHGIVPAGVIGCPVGFVGAAESKEELIRSGLEYITIRGVRGGSTIAASALNALGRHL